MHLHDVRGPWLVARFISTAALVALLLGCEQGAGGSVDTEESKRLATLIESEVASLPGPPEHLPDVSPAQVAAVLREVGIDSEMFSAYQTNRVPAVPAAARYIQGIADARDLAILSDVVVLATAQEWDRETLHHDGFGSTVLFKVDHIWRGVADLRGVAVRQLAGRQPDGTLLDISSDFHPVIGDQYLVFGSHAKWANLAETRSQTGPPATVTVVLLSPPWKVEGNAVFPTSRNHGSPSSMAAVTSLVEQGVRSLPGESGE